MKKFSSNQIGGKGTVRRKKKVVRNRNFTQKKTKEQLDFERRIDNINTEIQGIENDYKVIATNYINECIEDIFFELERYDVKKKENYRIIKDDPITFFKDKCMKNNVYKNNMYCILQEIFINDCIPHICDMFVTIQSYLNNKKYLVQEKDVIELTDKQCFDILKLDIASNPDKKQLKSQYKKLGRENHPDKHDVSERDTYEKIFTDIGKAYHLLCKRLNFSINK